MAEGFSVDPMTLLAASLDRYRVTDAGV